MGLSESPTSHAENQAARRRRRVTRRPRTRRCLLKGCEQRFGPRHVRQRYCSEGCRQAAREWSRCKARQRYRGTAAGKEKRNGQSQRYRAQRAPRVRNRKPPAEEAVPDAARVITTDTTSLFFSMPAATGLAATRDSCASPGRRCNGSARTRAGARWNAFGSESGAGSGDGPVNQVPLAVG